MKDQPTQPHEWLTLDDVPEPVWQAFQRQACGDAREERYARLVHRWQRARALGALPEGPSPEERLERGASLRDRTERVEPILIDGRGALSSAREALSSRGYLLLLADAEGVVVRTAGGGSFAEEARQVRLIEGACWSEEARGTNAIGTALTERCPVVVRGRAHYGRRFHGLACYAAPVRDPHGELVAVLDATSYAGRADEEVIRAVRAAAASLEDVLRLRAYAQAGASVARALSRALDELRGPALLVEAPGRIARLNSAARALLGVGAGGSARELLGLPWAQLTAEARAPSPGGLPLLRPSAPALTLRVEPIEAEGGALLAVLVLIDPGRAPLPRHRPAPGERTAGAPFRNIFAEDVRVQGSITLAQRVAPSELPVMLLAETGSGKELFAQAIHRASKRAQGPFVALNCGAISPHLLEGELFGHAPGAFTGASPKGRAGLLQAATGGTLFLDEVAEMSTAMQAALLRVLEAGEYLRLGDTRVSRADVRVICATCRDLPELVARGTFRNDLYFRLRGVTLRLPPLRERTDLLALAHHLLARLAEHAGQPAPTLSPAVEACFAAYPWPGNIRELRVTLELMLVLSQGAPQLTEEHLPPERQEELGVTGRGRRGAHIHPIPAPEEAPGALNAAEGEAVREALARANHNVSAAAKRLGVARSTLYRMMRRHQLSED